MVQLSGQQEAPDAEPRTALTRANLASEREVHAQERGRDDAPPGVNAPTTHSVSLAKKGERETPRAISDAEGIKGMAHSHRSRLRGSFLRKSDNPPPSVA